MKIGFDVSQTGPKKAGCGYYADGLIRALCELDREDTFLLYRTFGDTYWDHRWRLTAAKLGGDHVQMFPAQRTRIEMQKFWSALEHDSSRIGGPDILHSNNFFFPLDCGAPVVYTLYDLSFLEHPECTTEENRIACFDGVYKASIFAHTIVAISQATRNYFLETFPGCPPERVRVIYPGTRFERSLGQKVKRPRGLPKLSPQRFWLSVGTLEPRKNHKRLISAFARLRKITDVDMPLVLVGPSGWLLDDLKAHISTCGLGSEVVILGYVSDEILMWLYQNCYAFVYPSLFEGFGLPVLEAMTAGAPVISSNTTSIPEITGDVAYLVDPMSDRELFVAMKELAFDETKRDDLSQASRHRAELFSWTKAAREVLSVYESVKP